MEKLTFRPEPNGRVYAKVPAPVAINRLAEYEEAEEQGRIWVASPELKADIDELLKDDRDEEIAALKAENERLRADISCTDKCDVCRNSFSNEKYYDEGEQEYFPRRFKCDSCFLGGGEQNNFEWRGLEESTCGK